MRINRAKTALAALALGLACLAGPLTGEALAQQASGYIVVYKNGTDPHAATRALERSHAFSAGFVYRRALNGAFLPNLPPQALRAIRNRPNVAYVTRNRLATAFGNETTHYLRTRTDAVYPVGSGRTTNVDVAVLDTGADSSHPDLNVYQEMRVEESGPWHRPKINIVEGFGAAADGDGHGTHVSGIIGARDNGIDSGGRAVVGIAAGARIWAIKILDDNGSGSYAAIIAGIEWMIAHKDEIEVANLSLGGPVDPALNDAIAAAVQAGIVMVVASGNEGVDAGTTSPASAADAITVSALTDFDGQPGSLVSTTLDFGCLTGDDEYTCFSNYGASVDIMAPGVDILSTVPGGTYGLSSGTSMASPVVAGAIAAYMTENGITAANRSDVLALRDAVRDNGFQWGDAEYPIFGDPDTIPEPLLDVAGLFSGSTLNTPPVASADSASTDEDNAIAIAVLTNDSDADGDSLTIASVTQPANGSATIQGGTVTYTPSADFHGSDSFSYTVSDGQATNAAAISVTVAAVNDAPVANDDAVTVQEGQSVTIAVLANDSDVDGDALTVSITSGTATVNGNGSITYAAASAPGADSLTYRVSDPSGASDSAQVAITITEVNHAPTIAPIAARTDAEADTVTQAVTAADANGDPLTYSAAGLPDGLSIHAGSGTISGTLSFQAAGSHAVTVTVDDGRGGQASTSFTWTVTDTQVAGVQVSAMTSQSYNYGSRWEPGVRITLSDASQTYTVRASYVTYRGATGTVTGSTDVSGSVRLIGARIRKRDSSVAFTVVDITDSSGASVYTGGPDQLTVFKP